MSFFCESLNKFINFKYCMLCLKLTCLILLKYHMQYAIVKKCRFFMSCVCFCFSKHFESTTHCLATSFKFEQCFSMRVQIFGPIDQLCIMYIHFAIFRNFYANLLHLLGKASYLQTISEQQPNTSSICA